MRYNENQDLEVGCIKNIQFVDIVISLFSISFTTHRTTSIKIEKLEVSFLFEVVKESRNMPKK